MPAGRHNRHPKKNVETISERGSLNLSEYTM